MKIVKVIILLALGVIAIGLAPEFRHWVSQGFWPGFAGLLICMGAILIGSGIVTQIAGAPRPDQLADGSRDKVAGLLAAYPGPITLRTSRTGWVMMGMGVVSTALCVTFGIIAFSGWQAGDKAASDLAGSTIEPAVYGLWALAYSVLALSRGALRLDRNGFQTTFLGRKKYQWTEVRDFRIGRYLEVEFDVVKPRLLDVGGTSARFVSSDDKLGDKYGLKAEELADLMEFWQSSALDDQSLDPAVSE